MNIGEELLRLPISPVLKEVGICADQMGCGAYVVGGLVRDLFLRRETCDADVAIEGDGVAFSSRFAADHGASLTLYRKFRPERLLLPSGIKIDVATARTESYERPAALPIVKPGAIEDDLYRRDFSINALAACLNTARWGDLLDPFGSRRDVAAGLIRVLHGRSFIDDPTRIFRALRFEQRLGFSLEKETRRYMQQAVSAHLVERLSGYRIASELKLVMKEEEPLPIIQRLEESGVLSSVRKRGWKSGDVRNLLSRIDEVKLNI